MNLDFFYKALIEGLPDMVWGFDDQYILRVANSAFLDMRRALYSSELKIGDSLFKNVPDQTIQKWKPLYDRALKGERIIMDDSRMINGIHTRVKLSLNPVQDENGKTCACLGITYDVSDELFQESQRKQMFQNYYEVSKIFNFRLNSRLEKFYTLSEQLNNTNHFNIDDQNAMIFMINSELSEIGKQLKEINEIISRIKPV